MEVFVAFGDAPVFEESADDGGDGEAFALALEFFGFVVGVTELSEECSDVVNSVVVFFVVS